MRLDCHFLNWAKLWLVACKRWEREQYLSDCYPPSGIDTPPQATICIVVAVAVDPHHGPQEQLLFQAGLSCLLHAGPLPHLFILRKPSHMNIASNTPSYWDRACALGFHLICLPSQNLPIPTPHESFGRAAFQSHKAFVHPPPRRKQID